MGRTFFIETALRLQADEWFIASITRPIDCSWALEDGSNRNGTGYGRTSASTGGNVPPACKGDKESFQAASAFSGSSTSSMRLLRDVDSFAPGVDLVGLLTALTVRLLRAGRARDTFDAIAMGKCRFSSQ